MADFKQINTQEEFNAAIADRLSREAKKYEQYTSPDDLEKIKNNYQKQIDDLNAKYSDFEEKEKGYQEKIAKYEADSVKTRIAKEFNIPDGLIDRIRGETEEEMREDAKVLSSFSKNVAPLASTESNSEDKDKEYRNLLKNLNI